MDVAFWLLLAGAVMLVVGGLLAATMSFDTVRRAAAASVSDEQLHNYLSFHRGAGVICVLAAVGWASWPAGCGRGRAVPARAPSGSRW